MGGLRGLGWAGGPWLSRPSSCPRVPVPVLRGPKQLQLGLGVLGANCATGPPSRGQTPALVQSAEDCGAPVGVGAASDILGNCLLVFQLCSLLFLFLWSHNSPIWPRQVSQNPLRTHGKQQLS